VTAARRIPTAGRVDDTLRELRQALRTMRRHPAVPLLVVGILALGLGGFVALWSAADAVLWRPLGYARPDRLVRVWGSGNGNPRNPVNPLDVRDWDQRVRGFSGLATMNGGRANLTGAGVPDFVVVPRVSASLFPLLGATPALGRFFDAHDEVFGQHRVVVLSWDLWQSAFRGDPHALGRTVRLDGNPYTIVGVARRGFEDPDPWRLGHAALYRPFALRPTDTGRGGHYVAAFARLRDGVTLGAASAELATVQRQIQREHPDSAGWDTLVEPLQQSIAGPSRPALEILVAATALLLLLACGNVAALLLARATTRRGELTVRGALGATRVRLLRQLLLEMGVLGLAAGGLGLVVAELLLRGLRALAAGQVQLLERAGLDGRALLVAAAATVATVVIAGAAPALHAAGAALGARASASRERRRLERALVGAQLALCLVLLVGAALLARSLQQLYRVDPGFRAAGVWTFGAYLPSDRYSDDADGAPFFARLEERLRTLPGVESVGAVSVLPLSGAWSCSSIVVEHDEARESVSQPCAEERITTPGYFATMGMRPVAGRLLAARDAPHQPLAVVVSESFARHHWPDGTAVGRRVAWGDVVSAKSLWRTVVGVVPDVHHFGLDAKTKPEVYMPLGQEQTTDMEVVVRATGEPGALARELRAAVAAVDPQLPLARLRPLDELVAASTASRRLRTWAIGGFAVLATLLAAAGLYGSLAHAVAGRRRELCVRMAVGAGRRQILGLVIGEGAALAAAGLVVGGAGSIAAVRALRQLLFGVQPFDTTSFAVAAGLLATVALLAAWLPARRAAAVEPATALRAE
jgi:predicted permease